MKSNRFLPWLCAGILIRAGSAPAADRLGLEYHIKLIRNRPKPALEIELRFEGDPSGRTLLRLPSHWAGQKEYYKAISGLEALTPGAAISDGEKPDIKEITHAPFERLRIRYRLAQDFDGPLQNELHYRAVIQPRYFHMPGHSFLAFPDWDQDARRLITLSWEGLPASWSLADSFAANEKLQRFSESISDIQQGIYVAGDFRLHRIDVRGRPVWAALRGKWRFKDGQFLDLARAVIAAERSFWGDDDFPYYLITLIPIGGPCCSTGGTGMINSFATFANPETEMGLDWIHLLSHELFHAWNGTKIDREPPQALGYWFSEGFTDYYTYLLSLRAGLISLKEYVEIYNKILKAYFTSPVRAEPNTRIEADFWNDPFVERLPYQRGNILAHDWNAKIKQQSKDTASIDDMMRDLLKAATTRGVRVSISSIAELMSPYLPGTAAADLHEFIVDGKIMEVDPRSLGPCASLSMLDIAPFELGFDWSRSREDKTAHGVDPESRAYEAGLRDGQRFLALDIEHGDPSRLVKIEVMEGDGARKISYLPQRKWRKGEKPSLVPQFQLDERRLKSDPASCLSWFGAAK